MGKQCQKCGYVRQDSDHGPDYACPKCGVVYAKAEGTATKTCPYCGESIPIRASRCKHCQADLTRDAKPVARGADYGVFLIAIPVIATLVMWAWVANMNLLQGPGQALTLIGVLTVSLTALLAAVEVSQNEVLAKRGRKKEMGSIGWFLVILLIWIIAYPVYLSHRKKFGLNSHVVAGVIVALVFLVSQGFLFAGVQMQMNKVRALFGLAPQPTLFSSPASSTDAMEQYQKLLETTLDLYRLESGRYPSTEEGLEALIEPPGSVRDWNGPYLSGDLVRAIGRFDYEYTNGKIILTPK